MAKVRVHNISLSLDGYAAGPDQDLEHPLGVGGERLHEWVFATDFGRAMIGQPTGDDPGPALDNELLGTADDGVGATIMGRNMFGPVRGEWPDESWTGWWGEEPPYHHPVFVLTHHARPSLEMAGGTTFHFVTDGFESALRQALAAADGLDVRIGGGPSTIQQYVRAGLVDEMTVAIVPVLLGAGERLFDGVGTDALTAVSLQASPAVVHVRLARPAGA